jgi:hypothetical protein
MPPLLQTILFARSQAARRGPELAPAAPMFDSWIAWLATGTTHASYEAAWFSCPRCETALAARRLVLDDGVASNAVLVVLPFVGMVLVSLWSERLGRSESQKVEKQ